MGGGEERTNCPRQNNKDWRKTCNFAKHMHSRLTVPNLSEFLSQHLAQSAFSMNISFLLLPHLLLLLLNIFYLVPSTVWFCFLSSVQSSQSVVSNSLWPHGLQHTRPPCPSPAPRVYSNSCPLSQWCHLTISSSVIPFPSCLQSFPASGSFPMSQFFASGGQNIG